MPCPYQSIFRKVIEPAILNQTVLGRPDPCDYYSFVEAVRLHLLLSALQ